MGVAAGFDLSYIPSMTRELLEFHFHSHCDFNSGYSLAAKFSVI